MEQSIHMPFGSIALLGSGETSLAGGRIFEAVAKRLPSPLRIAILETPAGFELNSAQVAKRVAEFLVVRLQNFQPTIDIIPARKKGTNFSPDNAELIKPLFRANLIYLGAGSPTYATRQLRDSLAWNTIRARHRLGAAVIVASAATIAIGAFMIPVYEIFKVGEEIKCPPGLNLLGDLGLKVCFVPHWNNSDGGKDLDTSRCFLGKERYQQWHSMVPTDHKIIGLDEHTGIIIDFKRGLVEVSGASKITILQNKKKAIVKAKDSININQLGSLSDTKTPHNGISEFVWEMAKTSDQGGTDASIPESVARLMEKRKIARDLNDWEESDALREKIQRLGWNVKDSVNGQVVERTKKTG